MVTHCSEETFQPKDLLKQGPQEVSDLVPLQILFSVPPPHLCPDASAPLPVASSVLPFGLVTPDFFRVQV